MQMMHCSWAFGTMIGPLLVKPFLAPDYTHANMTADERVKIQHEVQQETHISTAYEICAGCSVLVALLHMVLLKLVKYKQHSAVDEDEREILGGDKESKVKMPLHYVLMVLALGVVLAACEGGIEINSGNFLQTFVNHVRLGLSTQKVNRLQSRLSHSNALHHRARL